MYAFISGKVIEKSPTLIVIDNNGIGYSISITLNTFSAIGEQTNIRLYTHLQIKEDAHVLYGFYTQSERDLFLLLITVSGVGCNTARLILSSLTVAETCNAISEGNIKVIQAVKGIGGKTAQRIIVDLKDKVKKAEFPTEIINNPHNTIKLEALSALMILGFNKIAIEKALDKLLHQMPEPSVEKLIKEALKVL
jgi:Holliday junction DNA helicase, RuvA subunit